MDRDDANSSRQAGECEARAWGKAYAGDYPAAFVLLSKAHELRRTGGGATDSSRVVRLEIAKAKTRQWQGAHGEAQTLLVEALWHAHLAGIDPDITSVLVSLADLALDVEDYHLAQAILKETLPRRLRDRYSSAGQLALLGLVEFGLGRPRHAVRLIGAAIALRDAIGVNRVIPAIAARMRRFHSAARQLLGEEDYDAQFRVGQATDLAAAVADALAS